MCIRDRNISSVNVNALQERFTFEFGEHPLHIDNPTISTPTTTGNEKLYFTTGPVVYCINRYDGSIIWQVELISMFEDPAGPLEPYSRSSPAINEIDRLIYITVSFTPASVLLALDFESGEKIWVTELDDNPESQATAQPIFHNDRVLFGVSSYDTAEDFRGSTGAVNATTGELLYQTYTIPQKYIVQGVTGCAVWGSGFPVDAESGVYYVSTGQAYSYSQSMKDCQTQKDSSPAFSDVECVPTDIHHDSILAIDLESGEILWNFRSIDYDAWTTACITNSSGCPNPRGPDNDFGQAPILFTGAQNKKYVAVGQKSGDYFGINAETGQLAWHTKLGAEDWLAGILWGSAFDQKRIYVLNANPRAEAYVMLNGNSTSHSIRVALDPNTGAVVWESPATVPRSFGAVSTANGVVYTCEKGGLLEALDAATGKSLWTYATGDECKAGPSIVDGAVYWATSHSLHAFSINPLNQDS
eukprot:TRINITY_DN9029_c0_g1_i3.p1 TRINITY_DN9029_c0_g1~~TRINITY_DN9029_c0_g1_i3.p1  ORF type:complete len:472 (-),score=61.15 TRINITY_DN9029_c0_g1_i3:78-1493(-)